MSEWLSYVRENGVSCAVAFNAELDDDVRADLPLCVEMTVAGFETSNDGFPTDAADERLYALEQRIETLLDDRDAVLSVTVATAGTYVFVAYASEDLSELCAASARESAFEVRGVTCKQDTQWQTYESWALHGEELEEVRDEAQLDELENAGDDLDAQHDIFFDFTFPDRRRAVEFSAELGEADETEPVEDIEAEVSVTVRGIPSGETIGGHRRRLTALAGRFDGIYEGWGAEPAG